METKHTKGEWTIGSRYRNEFNVNVIGIDALDAKFTNIAEVYGNDDELQELEFNAKLISAAPDLLEALMELVEWEKCHYIEPELLKKIKNAINKATK